jgi:hypothetical protein
LVPLHHVCVVRLECSGWIGGRGQSFRQTVGSWMVTGPHGAQNPKNLKLDWEKI